MDAGNIKVVLDSVPSAADTAYLLNAAHYVAAPNEVPFTQFELSTDITKCLNATSDSGVSIPIFIDYATIEDIPVITPTTAFSLKLNLRRPQRVWVADNIK